MKILIDSNIMLLKVILPDDFEIEEFEGGELNNELLIESKAEMLIVRSTTKCNEKLLQNSRVKFIGTATAGTDNIDSNYLNKKGIKWANAEGSNSISVAEYVTYAILKWKYDYQIYEDITIGIIGFGNVGSKIGKIFKNYGFKVLTCDPFIEVSKFPDIEFVQLNELINRANVISINTPLTFTGDHPTYRMLNENLFEIQKDSLLLNTARGGVLVENILPELADKKGLTYVLDVWENEPDINISIAESAFISTPHIAGHSYEGKLRGSLMMVDEIEKFSNININKNLLNSEISKTEKYALNELEIDELYQKLTANLNIEETSREFKSMLNKFSIEKFQKMRRNYKKHNETISGNSF